VALPVSPPAGIVHHADAYKLWLDPALRNGDPVQALLTPYRADDMIAYAVSTRVNNPAYDAPECVAPLV
jgi:putative SOS response-associated peptidase YedK